jgi:hypothetical protein
MSQTGLIDAVTDSASPYPNNEDNFRILIF